MPPGAHRRPRRFRRDQAGGLRDAQRSVTNNNNHMTRLPAADTRPILIVPYMWIGDFVRCHSVVKVLKSRWPDRPVDLLTTALCRPLADYMPGLRQAILGDLPRSRIALGEQRALAERLRANGYGLALIMPRTWKAALAPFLAGIPQRVGFVGEARFGLLNEWRWGERRLPRMVDRCATPGRPSSPRRSRPAPTSGRAPPAPPSTPRPPPQAATSAAGTTSSGRGHSAGTGAPSGKASAAQRSTMRGSRRSPQRHSLSSPKRASPTNPTRCGIPARNGASAAFQVRGMISASP